MDYGIITSIYVEHFVTYDRALIKPGRYLNVIIGPNGTGKSTIVCAIVIGLGGKLSIIGRAKEVGDYVKTGHENAKVEITLQMKDSEVKISRKFDRASTTTWLINDQVVGYSKVGELTKSFNIQMDNLCQFLPQEKVQEFSNLSPEELLVETLRSIGDPSLLKTFAKLKEMRVKHREVEKLLNEKNIYLKQQNDKINNLKDIVGNIKEKKKIQKKVLTLSQKKAWIFYDNKRKELLKAKEERDVYEKQVKELEKQLKPIDDKIKQISDTVDKLRGQDSMQMKDVVQKEGKIKALINKINSFDEEIQETEESWKQRKEAEANRERDILLIQQQIEKMKSDVQALIDEFGSIPDMEVKQGNLLYEIDAKRKESAILKDQINHLRHQDENIRREIQICDREMQKVQNIKAKRMEILRQRSEDAYEGVLWLQQNRDKFAATVHEPILLHINVKNKAFAKYLENVIPMRDLIAFVCEDKNDMNLLINYLRNERNLQVNVLHSDPNRNVDMNPYIALDDIRQFGFETYLISLFEAPPTIMNYLVSMYNLHNIPIGSNSVDDNIDRIPIDINTFFSRTQRYGVSISKYSGAKSTRIDTITGNHVLSVTVDVNLLKGIEEKLCQFEEQKGAIQSRIQSLNSELDENEKALNTLRESRNKFQQNITSIKTLNLNVQRKEQKLIDLQSERKSIDDIDEMFKNSIQNTIRKTLKLYNEINVLTEQCYKCSVINETSRLSLKIQQRKLAIIQSESAELRDKLNIARNTYQQLDKDLAPLKASAEKYLREAKELTEGLTPRDASFKNFEAAFNKIPQTIPEIENMLSELKVKLYCLGRDSNGEAVLDTYEKTQVAIEKTQQLIEQKQTESTKFIEEMTKIRTQWYPQVELLVDQINMNFSNYFSELKCSGELSLFYSLNLLDFDKYGLKIMVKFRDTDSLQELTRTHQSGGERALTTAVYMIALQNLSKVPFRCVDEINQGMDPINERRVFQLLVEITGTSKGSQYFFLTPKLLPGLQYPESVTVHCVYNGPYVIPHTEFSIDKYAKNIASILG